MLGEMWDSDKIKVRSIVKPNEDNGHCEDRVRIGPTFVALADGAGGQGLFAAAWAEYLLDHVPESPIKSAQAFTQWHNSIKDRFYFEKLEQVKREIPDLQEKFEREGALTTLLVMWYAPGENKTYMLSCGDSALFCKTKARFWSSIDYPEFMNNPYLVSCIENYPESKVKIASDTFYKTATYLLCSDTLAQYVQATYLFTHPAEKNAEQLKLVEDDYVRLSQYTIDLRKAGTAKMDFQKDILSKLRKALDNDESFKNHLYKLYDKKFLGYDDYSLIMIN
jgi:hypothetical protein